MYLYLSFFYFRMSRAVLTYNKKLGLLVDYKAEWALTKVMGLYPPDWKRPEVIPQMEDEIFGNHSTLRCSYYLLDSVSFAIHLSIHAVCHLYVFSLCF